MANNNWNNYTEKTATPVDADEVMVRDSADGKNKKLLFGTFWKWVAKKLNEATISELQTSNKTIVGALNQLNSDSFSTYGTDNGSQASLPVKKGGATVMIAYALGGYGNDGSITVMALFRYNYEGTECSMDYIYNRGNTIIENSISNNKNTIAFKAQNGSPISYLKIKIFNM